MITPHAAVSALVFGALLLGSTHLHDCDVRLCVNTHPGHLRRGTHQENVPGDVASIGFDDIEDGRYATPSLSTIAPDKAQIARLAVDRLIGRVDGSVTGPGTELWADWSLQARETTGGCRSSSRPTERNHQPITPEPSKPWVLRALQS